MHAGFSSSQGNRFLWMLRQPINLPTIVTNTQKPDESSATVSIHSLVLIKQIFIVLIKLTPLNEVLSMNDDSFKAQRER